MDDLELARILRDSRERPAPPSASMGSRAFMGRVTTASPAAGHFMLVQPQSVLGTETEGGAATVTDLGTTPTPVYLVGPGVPATGDQVVARWADWRWVARKSYTGPATIPFCSASLTSPLTYTFRYSQRGDVFPAYCTAGSDATLTLTWNGSFFSSGIVDLPGKCTGGFSEQTISPGNCHYYLLVTLKCVSGVLVMALQFFTDITGAHDAGGGPGTITIGSYTVSPFVLNITGDSSLSFTCYGTVTD